MTVLEQENSLACNGDTAWQVLADFGNFLPWATGGVGSSRVEGEGIGMIRHLDIPEVGLVSERLDSLDNASRTLAYSLTTDNMAGMTRYCASIQLVADGADRCILKWRGEFEPQPGLNSEDVKASLAASYNMMSQGLETFVNARA